MTRLLEKAFEAVSRLSPQEQDVIAGQVLEELASEKRWSESFASSQNTLESLADEALDEHRKGDTQDLDPDKL